MAEQAYAYVTLIPVAKGFQEKIASEMTGVGGVGGQVGKKFSSGFGGALKGIAGPLLAAFSTIAIADFAKKAVNAASSFEAEFEGVRQTFGDAAKAVQDFADNAAYSAGISETAALQAAKNFGGFANAAGLASAEAATFSTDLVQAAGDLASFNDVPVDQALAAISSGLAGQSEPLRQFSIFLDQATLSTQAAAMGFTGAFSALSQGEQTLVRQAAIMDQMGVSAGDFEAYADTYGNSLKTVQALFAEMQTEIGGALLPALARLMPAFIPIIETAGPALTKIFEALVPLIDAIAVNIGPLVEALSPLIDAFGLIVGAGSEILAAILPPLVKIFDALAPIVLKVVEAFMPLVEALLPPLIRLIEALLPFLEMVASSLGDFWIPILSKLVEAILPFVVYFIDLFARALEDLNTLLGPVFAALKPIADTLLAIAGIKPGDLDKTVTVTTQFKTAGAGTSVLDDYAYNTRTNTPVPKATVPQVPGPGGAGSGTDARKEIQKAIKGTKKAIKAAKKEYKKAVKEANAAFAETRAEISENYSMAVAKATIQRDEELAQALKDNARRVSEIQSDFAQRLDNIVQQSMDRLRDVYRSAVEINVASIFDGDVVAGSIDGTIEVMRQKLAAARQLLANAAALAAAGFSQTFIEQVVGAGTDVGNELATSILNATPEQQTEMRNLFNAIEVEASSGMDALSQTIYEKNGLATQELRNLYAQTQEELVVALAEQEQIYQETMAAIMERFNEALVEAKEVRDAALLEAQETLTLALEEAQQKFVDEIKRLKKEFKAVISDMQGMVSSMSSAIDKLMKKIAAAKAAASSVTSGAVAEVKKPKLALATGGLVTGPTNALIGEAGPELVIPLDRFESWMNMGAGGNGKALNYYAAPNQSLDNETELFNAMKRAKVVVGW